MTRDLRATRAVGASTPGDEAAEVTAFTRRLDAKEARAASDRGLVGRRYRVLAELGQGGTATVYLAVAQGPAGFHKLVVLKAMKRALSREAEFRQMFLNEAKLSARLAHPNIVQVQEVFEHEGIPFIVMEYLEGKPLSDVRREAEGGLPLHLHLRVIVEALQGLHHSHELHDYDGKPLAVVHRDVTPHNVFVGYDGQVKVLDFGIAKLSGSLVETRAGVIKGKIRYMSPEQIAGGEVDRRLDVYAAGVMLWEAATGRRMWGSLTEATIMHRITQGEVSPPSAVEPAVDPRLEAIVMRALSYAPEDRHATALELAEALEDFLGAHTRNSSTRDLRGFMEREFAASRDRVRALVDEQLRSEDETEVAGDGPVVLPAGGVSIFPRSSITDSRAETGAKGAPVASRARRWLIAAAVVGAFASVGVGWSLRPEPAALAPVTPSLPAAVVPSGSALADPPPAPRTLRVTAFPADASIVINGQRAPDNPARVEVSSAGDQHVVVEAPGHHSQEHRIAVHQSEDLVVRLEPRAAPVPSRDATSPAPPPLRPAKPQAAPSASTAPTAAPAPIDCSPPFVVVDGIKRFKAGCL